jgi:thymidine phosphorylase
MVIDVKVGSGAFMRDGDRAHALAHALVKTGNSCGIRTRALLTDMNQPLGRAVGNAYEVKECIDLLRGQVDPRTKPVLDLSIELSAHMLLLANVENSIERARVRLHAVVDSGEALAHFRRNVEAQGGEPRVCDDPQKFLPLATESFKVESPRSGFVAKINTAEVGHAIAAIGGGRVRIDDTIDPSVGFLSETKLGASINARDLIGTIYCDEASKAKEAAERIQAAYEIAEQPAQVPALMKEVINE